MLCYLTDVVVEEVTADVILFGTPAAYEYYVDRAQKKRAAQKPTIHP